MRTVAEIKKQLDDHYSGKKSLTSRASFELENEVYERIENYLLTNGTQLEYLVRPPVEMFFMDYDEISGFLFWQQSMRAKQLTKRTENDE